MKRFSRYTFAAAAAAALASCSVPAFAWPAPAFRASMPVVGAIAKAFPVAASATLPVAPSGQDVTTA